MEKSESIINLSKALLKFDAEIGIINKSSVNPFYKNAYAALPDILEAIKEPLQKSGLIVKQFPESDVALTTIIIHAETGEFISSTYNMRATKDDPQQQGSRITYQRRYAIGAVLGLNIDIDDDGNKASEPEKKEEKKPIEPTEPPKPWLTEKQFKQALERINAGEKEIYQSIVDNFLVKKDYRTQLETASKPKE
jgi:hypothetical protein